MPDKVMPGPVSGAGGIREAVCVHTKKIIDSCRDKDCIEDARVYLGGSSQEIIERATCVKGATAELVYVSTDVEPVNFNRGFYTVDVRYYYRVTAEACVGAVRPVEISGIAVFDKRVILYGGEGNAKTFSSEVVFDGPDIPALPKADQPVAVVEAVDPLVLSARLVEPCDPCGCDCGCSCGGCGCGCHCSFHDVPRCVCNCLDSEICFQSDTKRLYVSLGQFSIIRLERDTQLLIPAYDYCIPDKECPGEGCSPEENPCELFRHVKFPVQEFFPAPAPDYDSGFGGSCGCGGCHCHCDDHDHGDDGCECGREDSCSCPTSGCSSNCGSGCSCSTGCGHRPHGCR